MCACMWEWFFFQFLVKKWMFLPTQTCDIDSVSPGWLMFSRLATCSRRRWTTNICRQLVSKIKARTGLNHAHSCHLTSLHLGGTVFEMCPGFKNPPANQPRRAHFHRGQTESYWVKISPPRTRQNVWALRCWETLLGSTEDLHCNWS